LLQKKTALKSQSLQYHRLTYLIGHATLIHNDLVNKHPAFAALTLVPGGQFRQWFGHDFNAAQLLGLKRGLINKVLGTGHIFGWHSFGDYFQ
jgi:hypothetical protein